MCDRDTLAAVTRTVNVPTAAKLQERFAPPEPVRLDGVTVQLVLFDARPTTPANPLILMTVMAEAPAEPALTITDWGLVVIEKS